MTQTFLLQDIFKIVKDSNNSLEPSFMSIDAYWKAMLRWVQTQLISQRKILIPNFAFLNNTQIKQNKVIVLQVLSTVLEQKQLVNKQDIHEFSKPIVNLHYTAIGKTLNKDEEPQYFVHTLEKVFKVILDIMNKDNVVIDLGVLGKIIIHEKYLKIQYFIRNKKKLDGKMFVSQIITNKQNSFRVKTIKREASQLEQRTKPIQKFSILNHSTFSQNIKLDNINLSPNLGTTSKNNMKSDFTKYLDMLGQVSDPLGRGYNFSDLTKSPAQLLQTNFIKSDYCEPRFPPVLDNSVRTLSSPITNQKYNLSICGRIACNYNITTRSLYFDHKLRCIKKYTQVEGIKFKAQPALLQTPATDKQQLIYLSQGKEQLARKVSSRQKCYERYNEYILKQIPHTLIKPIDNTQIKRILDLSGVNSKIIKDQKLTEVIDKNLEIIVQNYYYSGRKAILDYTLKDYDQRQRIGIVEILKQPLTWGTRKQNIIALKPFDRKYFKESKHYIHQNLLLSQSARIIKSNWQQYQKQLFVALPAQFSATNLLYFIKKQHQKIQQIRQLLRGKWRQSVIVLVKQQIKIIKHKSKVTSLYRSTDALMVNLVRSLIQESIHKYLQFFQQFKKDKYKTVQNILEDQDNIVQNGFLIVKLKVQGRQIVFAQNLKNHVKPQLLSLLELMIQESKYFKSISSSQSNLWQMTKSDHIYINSYKKIEQIINQNIEQIQKSVNIYQQYQVILHKQDEIQKWCLNQQHTIEQYNILIQQIQSLSTKILNTLPFTLRMNMIIVDGTQLKKKYISTLSEIQHYIYQKIHEKIKTFYLQIKSKIQSMKIGMKQKVDSPLKWVEMQQLILNIKRIEVPELKIQFVNLNKWMNLLFSKGSNLLTQADLMQIYLISQNITNLSAFITNQEQRISTQKQQIQLSLKSQLLSFVQNINKLSKQLQQMIKQFTVRRQCSNYNDLLKRISAKYEDAILMRQQINSKQKHLGWGVTKFSQLEQIKKSLSLTTQFWNTIGIIQLKIKSWRDSSVKNIVPQDLSQFLTSNLFQLRRMYDQQLGKQILPSQVIKDVNKQLLDMQQKYMPLVRIFANKGLKQRHWQAFAKQFSICQNKQTLTLNKLITYKIHQSFDKIDILAQISESATKQFVVEKQKIKMMQEWFPLTLTSKTFKDTDLTVVGTQFQPLMDLLSSQLQKTQALKQLQQAKIFEQNLTQWQLWLKHTQSLFAQWYKVQNSWTNLYVTFSDEQIIKNFPLQYSQFESITNSWKSIMRRVQQQPRIVELTKNKKMLDVFLESNMKLSVMQNTISTYVQQKQQKQNEQVQEQYQKSSQNIE